MDDMPNVLPVITFLLHGRVVGSSSDVVTKGVIVPWDGEVDDADDSTFEIEVPNRETAALWLQAMILPEDTRSVDLSRLEECLIPIETERRMLGRIGVDTGQVIVIDPCYIEKSRLGNWHDVVEEILDAYKPRGLYASYPPNGNSGGLLVRTGLGDGLYAVYGYFRTIPGWGERTCRVELVFLSGPDLTDDL